MLKNYQEIQKVFVRDFGKKPTQADIELVNKAMEGDLIARAQVKERSPGLADSLLNFTKLRDRVRKEIKDPRLQPQLSEGIKDIYALKENYVRDIFEKFTKAGRQDFNLWKKMQRIKILLHVFVTLLLQMKHLVKHPDLETKLVT